MLSPHPARLVLTASALLALASALPASAQTTMDYRETGTLNYIIPPFADHPAQYSTDLYANFGRGTSGHDPFYATSSLFFFGQPSPSDFGSIYLLAGQEQYFRTVTGSLAGLLTGGSLVGDTYTADIDVISAGGIFADLAGTDRAS